MKNIFLTGFMGSGKSTVGRLLSEKSGLPLLDTDRMLEQASGLSVVEIFGQFGEAYFREMEAELLERLCHQSGHIISTGGGVVLKPENVMWMQKGGTVVFLDVPVDTIRMRLKNDKTRPLLSDDKYAQLDSLWAQRHPLYLKAARLTVRGRDSGCLADQIIEELNLSPAAGQKGSV